MVEEPDRHEEDEHEGMAEEGAEDATDPDLVGDHAGAKETNSDEQNATVEDLIREIETELAHEPVPRRVRSKSRPRDDETAAASCKKAPASPRSGPKKREDPTPSEPAPAPAKAAVSEAATVALKDRAKCAERRW